MTVVNIKKEADALQKELAGMTDQLQSNKEIIEAKLKDVKPILEAAKSSVSKLEKKYISEMSSLRAPKQSIRSVLQAVLLLMGQRFIMEIYAIIYVNHL